jgi:cyclohexanone monooxygenase
MGVTVNNYPNMFMVLGPNGPFTNLPPSIESQVEWISDTIQYTVENNVESIEATKEAEEQWTQTCANIAEMTLFPKAQSGFLVRISRARKTRFTSISVV